MPGFFCADLVDDKSKESVASDAAERGIDYAAERVEREGEGTRWTSRQPFELQAHKRATSGIRLARCQLCPRAFSVGGTVADACGLFEPSDPRTPEHLKFLRGLQEQPASIRDSRATVRLCDGASGLAS